MLSRFLALSVLIKHETSFKTVGARTGLARLEGRKRGRNNHGKKKGVGSESKGGEKKKEMSRGGKRETYL